VATRPSEVLKGVPSCTVTSHCGTVPSDSTMDSDDAGSSLGSLRAEGVQGNPPKPDCAGRKAARSSWEALNQ